MTSSFLRIWCAIGLLSIPCIAPAQNHGMGAIPPTTINPAPNPPAGAAIASVPVSVDLTAWSVPVGDQGSVNSCVAWAIAHSMMGWYSKRGGQVQTNFAPMYMYSQIVMVDGSGRDTGSRPLDALPLAQNQGVDIESDYTQGDYDWHDLPTASERANAAQYKINAWHNLFTGTAGPNGVLAIKAALANSQPVAILFPVRPGFEILSPTNTLDSDTTGPIRDYHEVLAVGYDADALLVQNSWGTNWGSGGYGRLSWGVVQNDVVEADVIDQAYGFPVAPRVTPSAGANGTISPAAPVSVGYRSAATFTVTPNAGYVASIGGTCGGNLSGTTYTTNPVTADCTVVATFTNKTILAAILLNQDQYNLSVNTSSGGTVTSADGAIHCGTKCSASYDSGTGVTLTATPTAGHNFSGWTGACSGSANTCVISMSGMANVSATFN